MPADTVHASAQGGLWCWDEASCTGVSVSRFRLSLATGLVRCEFSAAASRLAMRRVPQTHRAPPSIAPPRTRQQSSPSRPSLSLTILPPAFTTLPHLTARVEIAVVYVILRVPRLHLSRRRGKRLSSSLRRVVTDWLVSSFCGCASFLPCQTVLFSVLCHALAGAPVPTQAAPLLPRVLASLEEKSLPFTRELSRVIVLVPPHPQASSTRERKARSSLRTSPTCPTAPATVRAAGVASCREQRTPRIAPATACLTLPHATL